jgi:hypothetical protein
MGLSRLHRERKLGGVPTHYKHFRILKANPVPGTLNFEPSAGCGSRKADMGGDRIRGGLTRHDDFSD